MQRAGGRFFSYNENLDCYEDQCFKDSVTKTSQALREDQRIVKEKIRANLASRTLTNVPPRSVKFWSGCSESLFKALFDGCNPEMLPAMISAHYNKISDATLILHSLTCHSKLCDVQNCPKMKQYLTHIAECDLGSSACPHCGDMWTLICKHAKRFKKAEQY